MKKNFLISIIVLVLVLSMTVGYAVYSKIVEFSGTVTLEPDGVIEVINIEMTDSSNVLSSEIPIVTNNSIEFNLVFEGNNDEFYAIYRMEIVNNSSYDFVYNSFEFYPIVNSTSGATGTLSLEVEGIANYDIIRSQETRIITMKLIMIPSDPSQSYNAQGTTNIETTQQNKGNIIYNAVVIDNDLRGIDNYGSIKLSIINTYSDEINVLIESSNTSFVLINADGITMSNIVLQPNSEEEIYIYLNESENAIFIEETSNTNLILKINNIGNMYTDDMLFYVDKTEEIDDTIPEIGEVLFTMSTTQNQAEVNFSRLDTGGSSIINYVILLYDENDNLINTYNTNSAITQYTITSIDEGSYYVKVYGIDEAGNSGEGEINNSTISNIYCRKSNNVTLKWIFNVDYSGLSNIRFSGSNTAIYGQSYQATLSTSGNYTLPATITVKVNDVQLSAGNDYSYDRTTGVLNIANVIGDIYISGNGVYSGICLVEGTKIRLANNLYKNIEEITYRDLLAVWSYDTGTITKEYPIWIEKERKTEKYQLTEFSDGTTLKTVGYHGVFNTDINLFVSVDDNINFKVGTNILKIDINGNFKIVEVKNIKYVEEQINFYHVVSTRYYNIIADDFLTTDGTVILSNLYGFNEDLTWGNNRQYLLDNVYKYEELDILPYYMYKGLRAEEAKNLEQYGINLEVFKDYLISNQLNENMLKPVETNESNIRLWMITTNEDTVNDDNQEDFLHEEGELFKVPYPTNHENFIYWYNTSDNKIYYPEDLVEVHHGMHFEAVYK